MYLSERNLYGSSRLGQEQLNIQMTGAGYTYTGLLNNEVGDKRFEFSNHQNSVLVIITDRKLPVDDGNGDVDYYTADVVSYSDYYPYGMLLPNRHGSDADGYRYGFNGMEADDEIKDGDKNSYDFGARMYDPRVGRFLTIDPKASVYPYMSPYCYAANSPILFIDENGEGPIVGWKVKNRVLEDGTKVITMTITVRRRIFLVNQSKMNISSVEGNRLARDMAQMYSADMSYTFREGVGGSDVDIMYQLRRLYTHIPEDQKLVLEVKLSRRADGYFKKLEEINDPDASLVGIRDDVIGSGGSTVGLAVYGGDAAIIEAGHEETKPKLDENNTTVPGSNTSVHEMTHWDGASDLYDRPNKADNKTLMGKSSNNFVLDAETQKEIIVFYTNIALTGNGINAGRKDYDRAKKSGKYKQVSGDNNSIIYTSKDRGRSNKQQLNDLD